MGRPRKEPVHENVEGVPIDTDSAVPDLSRRMKPEDFFGYCETVAEELFTPYLYRTWPLIDRKRTGNHKYIAKRPTKGLSAEFVRRNYGTGKYQIQLLDNQTTGRVVAGCNLEFPFDADLPPVVDPAEVIECNDNKGFIEALKLRGKWPGAENGNQAGGGDLSARLARIEAALDKGVRTPEIAATETVGRMLEKTLESSSTLLVEQVKAMKGGGGEGDGKLVAALIDANTKLTLALVNQPKPASGSLLEEVKALNELRNELRDDRPAGGESSFPAWLAMLVPALAPLAEKLLSGLAAAQPGAAALPSPVAPVASLSGVASPGAAVAAASGVSQSAGVPASSSGGADMLAIYLPMAAQRIAAALDSETSGFVFADHLETLAGSEVVQGLADMGADGILSLLKCNKAAWAVLAPYESRLPQFVADFVSYSEGGN